MPPSMIPNSSKHLLHTTLRLKLRAIFFWGEKGLPMISFTHRKKNPGVQTKALGLQWGCQSILTQCFLTFFLKPNFGDAGATCWPTQNASSQRTSNAKSRGGSHSNFTATNNFPKKISPENSARFGDHFWFPTWAKMGETRSRMDGPSWGSVLANRVDTALTYAMCPCVREDVSKLKRLRGSGYFQSTYYKSNVYSTFWLNLVSLGEKTDKTNIFFTIIQFTCFTSQQIRL